MQIEYRGKTHTVKKQKDGRWTNTTGKVFLGFSAENLVAGAVVVPQVATKQPSRDTGANKPGSQVVT
jgi:hypothetical protein